MYTRYAALQTVIEARERAAEEAERKAREDAISRSSTRPKARLSRVIVATLLRIIGIVS